MPENKINQNLDAIGYFGLLPEEILIEIFKLLTIQELSVMALVNNKIRDFIIEHFLLRSSGFLFLIRAGQDPIEVSNNQQYSFVFQLFSSVGLLLKRCTFLFRTKERINLLIYLLENSYDIPSLRTFNHFDYHSFKLIYKCYGKLIHKLITGWGDFECEHVFSALKNVMEIDVHIQKFLSSSLGSRCKNELLIRNFFRMICSNIDSYENFKERLTWLVKTTNAFSIQEIAKLFIVIFGPLVTINNSFNSLPYIAWWDVTDSNFNNGFEDLGLTFFYLYKYSNELLWNKEYLLQLIDCIIETPTDWTYSNISCFFYYAGYELTLKFFNKKMKDGKIMDVATYLCYLNVVTYKQSQDLSPIMRLIDYLTEEEGNELTDEFILAFSSAIYDADLFNEDDHDENRLESSEIIDSQLELMKLILLKLIQMKKVI